MYDFTFYLNFNMLYKLRSYKKNQSINGYMCDKLSYLYRGYVVMDEKPTDYTICLYDVHKKVYYVYDENSYVSNGINRDKKSTISYHTTSYVKENLNLFKLCFLEMKSYIINLLNTTTLLSFKIHFIEYFDVLRQMHNIDKVYYDNFISIINSIDNDNIKIGDYILEKYGQYMNLLLTNYMVVDKNAITIIDAYYIILSIQHLCDHSLYLTNLTL